MHIVTLVIFVKVPVDSDGRKWTSQGIDNEDGGNQEGKDLVRESCRVFHEAIQVKESSEQEEHSRPETSPRVESQEIDIHGLGNIKENGAERQHGSCSSVNHLYQGIGAVRYGEREQRCIRTIGCPPSKAYTIPHQAVAINISTAPI